MKPYRRLKNGWIVELSPPIKAMLDRITEQSHFSEEEVIEAGIRLMAAYTGAKIQLRSRPKPTRFSSAQGVIRHVAQKKSLAAKR